ncbi:MAG TPA: FAD-binding oxidoreductase [Candidatus Saccharimonadales bacterium]|jgi:FAD/FMN-containing dehydrogenase|nr:FAD-binding oxidoreductase [Candidatus Saccharimonadales bacterium]
MSKVAHYLQEHLVGEVMTSADARRYFSTDGSVLSVTPALIAYPRNENDVRKTARFTWQLAERGRVIPITARGAGTDQSGAALGAGIILAFPAHMHRVLELDAKSGVVIVEPGTNYGKLQQTLQTHDRFLPPFPASMEYSTIGGAVANNASGEKSIKYGSTRDFVRGLRVVLANGEVIETSRLTKRDLNKKLGLATFEGEIYRAIDALIDENHELIEKLRLGVTKNSAGYDLAGVKRKDGSIDLTPLFVGSQGTLGLITEIALETEVYNANTTLLVAHFDDLEKLQAAVLELRGLPEMPSAVEMVDDQLLNLVDKINPNLLKDVLPKPFPKVVLLIEFDNASERMLKKLTKKASKIADAHAASWAIENDPYKQEQLWKIRHSSATVVAHGENGVKALPLIEDGVVPPERFREYLEGVYQLFARHHLQAAVWGHAGDANLHMQPFLDLSQVGDRQKAFRILEEYYSLVISLGGSTSGEHGDGRIRGPYLEKLYGAETYALFGKVKQIFDPYGTLNPGVKMGVTLDSIKPLLRSTYTMDHLYDHLPRS